MTLFTLEELNHLLKMIRARLADLSLGLHRYWLTRTNKSLSEGELLAPMKEEQRLLTLIRNKLWRMKGERLTKRKTDGPDPK